MFSRLTQSLDKLSERAQFKLLRRLVEGELSYKDVIKSHESFGVATLDTGEWAMVKDLNNMIENFNHHFIDHADPKFKLLKEYANLPLGERYLQSKEYELKLQLNDHRSTNIKTEFCRMTDRDYSIYFAIHELVDIFSYRLSKIAGLTPQIVNNIFDQLIKDPLKIAESCVKNKDVKNIVMRFQFFLDRLMHSYIDLDVSNYLCQKMVVALLMAEQMNRVGLYQTLNFLSTLKERMRKEISGSTIDKLFNIKIHNDVCEIYCLLETLPKEIDTMKDGSLEKIKTVKSVFAAIYQIIQGESNGVSIGATRKFWHELSNEMSVIASQEDVLQKSEMNKISLTQ